MKDDIPLKIFASLINSDIPIGRKEICIICKIQPQLFDYWITILLQDNILIQDERKRYTIQKIFKDKTLPAMIIPLIKTIADNIKVNELEEKDVLTKEKCVSANLSLYMKYLAEDII